MYVADQHLMTGSGAIAYAAGSEVPEKALNSDMGKRMGWKELVSEGRTKTLRADGAGTEKPTPAAKEAPTATK
jgi:hypothetical protein